MLPPRLPVAQTENLGQLTVRNHCIRVDHAGALHGSREKMHTNRLCYPRKTEDSHYLPAGLYSLHSICFKPDCASGSRNCKCYHDTQYDNIRVRIDLIPVSCFASGEDCGDRHKNARTYDRPHHLAETSMSTDSHICCVNEQVTD